MRKTLFTGSIVALAVTFGFATSASAQNPFSIDGKITPTSNSGRCRDGSLPSAHTGGTCPATAELTPQALQTNDKNGSSKELGPINGSNTKIGVIHTAAVTMLGETNPNTQVDLNRVFLQDQKDGNGHFWVYFGWLRDSTTGSGFISLEGQVAKSNCDYSSEAKLLECNLWQNRAVDDFLISWDQQGGSRDIYLRVFSGTSFVTPSSCPPAQVTSLGCKLNPSEAVALYTVQDAAHKAGEGGELAVDLTALGLVPANSCKSFANIIPGTVTGNSDTADYKDVVLADLGFDACAKISVTKVTKDPAGDNLVDTTSGFKYTLEKVGGATLAVNKEIKSGQVDSYIDLQAGQYKLSELTPLPGKYDSALTKIQCNGTSGTTLSLTFTVVEDADVACTITNQLPPGTPGISTTPVVKAFIFDDVEIRLEYPLPAGTTVKGLLELFKNDNQCGASSKVTSWGLDFTFNASGIARAGTLDTAGVAAENGAKYYWRASYPGDKFNKAVTPGACAELTTVNWVATPHP